MSLESDRRASGAAMEASRRASGVAMEASRRSGGSTLKRDLNSLESGARKVAELTKVEVKGARPARTGVSYYTPPAAGGGIASPLTETEVDGVGDREYWPAMIQTTTDGLFSFEVKPIKKWQFKDADNNPVVMNVALPPELI